MNDIYLKIITDTDNTADGTFSRITKADELPKIIQIYQYTNDTGDSRLHGTIFCEQRTTTDNNPDALGYLIQFLLPNNYSTLVGEEISNATYIVDLQNKFTENNDKYDKYPISAEFLFDRFVIFKISDYSVQSQSPFFEDFVPEIFYDGSFIAITLNYVCILKSYSNKTAYILIDKTFFDQGTPKPSIENVSYMVLHPKRILNQEYHNTDNTSTKNSTYAEYTITNTFPKYNGATTNNGYFSSCSDFSDFQLIQGSRSAQYSDPLKLKYFKITPYYENNSKKRVLVSKQNNYFDSIMMQQRYLNNNDNTTQPLPRFNKNQTYKINFNVPTETKDEAQPDFLEGMQAHYITNNIYNYNNKTCFIRTCAVSRQIRLGKLFDMVPKINLKQDILYYDGRYNKGNPETLVGSNNSGKTIYARLYLNESLKEDFDSEERLQIDNDSADYLATDETNVNEFSIKRNSWCYKTEDSTAKQRSEDATLLEYDLAYNEISASINNNTVSFTFNKKHPYQSLCSFYVKSTNDLGSAFIMCRSMPIPLEKKQVYSDLWHYYIPRFYLKIDTRKIIDAELKRENFSENLLNSIENKIIFERNITSDVKFYYFDFIIDNILSSIKTKSSIENPFIVSGNLLTYNDSIATPLNIIQ